MNNPTWQQLASLNDQVTWAKLLISLCRFYHYSPANAYQIAAWQIQLAKTIPNLAIGELALSRAGWNFISEGLSGRSIKKSARPLTLTFFDLTGKRQSINLYTYSQTYGRNIRKEALPAPLSAPALQDKLHAILATRSLSVTRTPTAPPFGDLTENARAITLPQSPLTAPLIHAVSHILDQKDHLELRHDGTGEIVAQAVTYALSKHINDPDTPPPPAPPAKWSGKNSDLTENVYSRIIYVIRQILPNIENTDLQAFNQAANRLVIKEKIAQAIPANNPNTEEATDASNTSNLRIAGNNAGGLPGDTPQKPHPVTLPKPLTLFTPNKRGQYLNLTIAARLPDNEAEKLASRLRTLKAAFNTAELNQNQTLMQAAKKAGYLTGPVLFAGETPLMQGADWKQIMKAVSKARTLLPVEERPESRVRGQKPYQLAANQGRDL